LAQNELSFTGAYLVPVLRDQRAVGHHRPNEQENLLVLHDLAETGRVASRSLISGRR
jgi:hypothetical protein